MLAEIITIGDEILTGQTIDTNSAYIAAQLNLIGIQIVEISSIRDEENHIVQALENSFKKTNLVIITGGLGPTNDDITKHVLTKYFDDVLVLNQKILDRIENYFNQINVPVLEVNRQQAMLPSRARIIDNDLGTASGMWFSKDGRHVISLPGVPYEMKGLMEKIIPLFRESFNLADYYHQTIQFQGIGESRLAELLSDLETKCNHDRIGVAYLPSPGIVKMRFTGKRSQKAKIDRIIVELLSDHPKIAFGMENESLEQVVGKLLVKEGRTIGTVESCTGGGLSNRITAVPGSSAYYMGSFVSYDNRIKTNLVGVDPQILKSVGAVSEEVVKAMAENGRLKLGVDYCIATSGIAGPDGGTPEKPVGTIWVSIATPEHTFSKKFQFKQNRERNIELTIVHSLNYLRRILLQLEEKD